MRAAALLQAVIAKPSSSEDSRLILQRKCACGAGASVLTGECEDCGEKKGLGLQPKLRLAEPGDAWEREADRTADAVMRMAEPTVRRGSLPPLRQRRDPDPFRESLVAVLPRRMPDRTPGPYSADAPAALVDQARSAPGRTLDAAARSFMEVRFGHDFGKVRIHTGKEAARSARAVNALAYTVGWHVAFADGQYSPASRDGRRLLAHELAHVVQQQSAPKRPVISNHLLPDAVTETHGSDSVADVAANAANGSRPEGLQKKEAQGVASAKPARREREDGLPECPEIGDPDSVEGVRQSLCTSEDMKKNDPVDCEFTRQQWSLLHGARRQAERCVRRGLARIQAGKDGERLAVDLAVKLFEGEAPSVEEVKKVLGKLREFLQGSGLEFKGKGCGAPACHRVGEAIAAYVTAAGKMPIYVCPLAFADPSAVYRTVIHESLHWSGIDADPTTTEGYCDAFDCATPCLDKEAADAWAHYIACLGECDASAVDEQGTGGSPYPTDSIEPGWDG